MRRTCSLFIPLIFSLVSTSAGGQFGNSMLLLAGSIPSIPTGLTASGTSATQINLLWNDNSNNESSFIIQRSANGSSGWTLIANKLANANSHADTLLSEGTAYYYRVYATSVDGPSGFSATATGTTPLIAPSSLSASPASTSQINLSWTDNSSAESGYQVERSTDNSTWTTIGTTVANATSYASTGLSACQTYYYRIKAINGISASAYPSSVNGRTLASGGTVNFTSSGSWTVPGCVTSVTIQVWGGGGGGGSGYYYAGAGGGGGGGSASKSFAVSAGQSISFTVGGGGGGRAAGGTTSCSGMNAGGGSPGGNSRNNSTGVGAGGAAGGANGGSSNWSGGNGGAGGAANSSNGYRGPGGAGGASAVGGPGNGGNGGGGSADGAGGGTGMVRITY